MPFWQGVLTGLMLQVAIGPVFFYVTDAALASGPGQGLAAVAGVVVTDAVFVTLAVLGVGRVLERPRVKLVATLVGAAVLLGFGAQAVASFWVPVDAASTPGDHGFWGSLVLTASSPLTIVFWMGVFSTRLAAADYDQASIRWFAAGSVTATALFLGLWVVVLGLVRATIPTAVVSWSHLVVGVLLVAYALRSVLRTFLARPS